MDANGRSVAQEVVAHELGLDNRFATGGFYGKGIYLAERVTYPIGGRYVRSAGLAPRPSMHGACGVQVCTPCGGDARQARAAAGGARGPGNAAGACEHPPQCTRSRCGGMRDGGCSSWFWTGARRDDRC